MDLITGALLVGVGWFGVKALSGSKKSSTKTTGGGGVGPGCTDAAKDCKTLIACANDVLAKATAADTVTLTKMSAKAGALGCTDLVKQISAKLKELGLGGVGVSTPPPAGSYSVAHDVGLVMTASDGDMLIIGLLSATGQKFVVPVIFSGGKGVFEKALADIALSKFEAEATKSGLDPLAFFKAGGVTLGAPSDLADGTSFAISFARPKGPADVFPNLGDVIGTVTAAQMKSSFTLAATNPAATAFAGEETAEVGSEGVFDERPSLFGGPFGRQAGSGIGLGSAFGAKSSFGRTTVGG